MNTTIFLAQFLGILYIVFSAASMYKREVVRSLIQSAEKSPGRFFTWGVVGLPLGLLIVALHGGWASFAGTVVGILGWAMVLESLMYLFLPRRSLVALVARFEDNSVIIASGIIGLGLGITLLLTGLQIL